ncbi:hypothetical protein [Polaromonas sp. UC242_47]|uniref:hypothetical protein n=1 Tax=Polaromonas sp. UC242_47 TaxID=3374626 RepID=UPI0037B40E67
MRRHVGRVAGGNPGCRRPAGPALQTGHRFQRCPAKNPPAVGSWVTYRFRGLNNSGIPRFASFMRVREDMPPARP